MKDFYFTYGSSESMPYKGGWSIVKANDRDQAIEIFRAVHPNAPNSVCVNCAGIYTEEHFKETSMYKKDDNLGHNCWETIELNIIK